MEKELARAIIPLVNDVDHYPLLQQYVEERIEVLRTFLEKTTEHEKIREIQGAIAELRRFQPLRDQALEGAK